MNHSVRCLGILVAASAGYTSAYGSPVAITTAFGNGADGFIQGGTQANSNFSSETLIRVKYDSPVNPNVQRKSYMRFDTSALHHGATVQSASLALHFLSASATFTSPLSIEVWGLLDGHVGENWLESGITWNNAPGNDVTSGTAMDTGVMQSLGTFSVAPSDHGTVVSFTSPDLVAFLNANTNGSVTLALTRIGTQSVDVLGFASHRRLDGAPPTLNLVTNGIIPLPSAGLLGIGGIVMLAGVRHRRH